MNDSTSHEVTRILAALGAGDQDASERLICRVYQELRQLARRRLSHEVQRHSLQPTDLVHEAYLRLMDGQPQSWNHRGHFFASAAEAMRRILVERARARARLKRGGDREHFELVDEDARIEVDEPRAVLALDGALARLERQDPRMATIVKLRFFGGLSVDEVAEALSLASRTVEREWATARAWLRIEVEHDA